MVNDQDIYIVPLQKQTNHCSVLKSTSGKSQHSPAIWITKASEDSKENTYMLMHLCTRFKTINASKYCKKLDGLTMHMLVIWIGFATSVLGASLLLFLLLRDSEDMPYILPLRSKGSVAFGLRRSKCFPTLTFHTSWSTLENSHSRDRRKALWRNNMISRVRTNDYKESWRFEQQNT